MKLRRLFGEYIARPFEEDLLTKRIGEAPQKYLISSLLKDRPSQSQAEKLKSELNIDIEAEKNDQIGKLARQAEYYLQNEDYFNYMRKHPNGKVHIFKYQGVQFTLSGSNWETVPNKNIYKLLLNSMPDLIMLQIRPDHILRNFDIRYTGSSTKYVESLIRSAYEIMPTGYANKISEELQIKINFKDEYMPYQLNERIQLDQIATACHYGIRNNIPILLVDLPDKIFRQSLVNQMTIPQLNQIFEKCSQMVPLYPDLQPQTPLNVGYNIFPDIFLQRSDQYISTIIEYLAVKKKYKKVFGLFGNAQSDSINDLLDNRKASHLENELQIPKIQRSILKDLTCEDLVERHAILDVIQENIIIQYFPTTDYVIQQFADPHQKDKTRVAQMQYLHTEMMKNYWNVLKKQQEIGQRDLKREFMKKAQVI
ncbi:hypothetical protein pb186bvf_007166 [Paramecium bursaria]